MPDDEPQVLDRPTGAPSQADQLARLRLLLADATTRLLGEYMGADRVMYAEVNGEPGAETGTIHSQYTRPSIEGTSAAVPFPERFTFDQSGRDVGDGTIPVGNG